MLSLSDAKAKLCYVHNQNVIKRYCEPPRHSSLPAGLHPAPLLSLHQSRLPNEKDGQISAWTGILKTQTVLIFGCRGTVDRKANCSGQGPGRHAPQTLLPLRGCTNQSCGSVSEAPLRHHSGPHHLPLPDFYKTPNVALLPPLSRHPLPPRLEYTSRSPS